MTTMKMISEVSYKNGVYYRLDCSKRNEDESIIHNFDRIKMGCKCVVKKFWNKKKKDWRKSFKNIKRIHNGDSKMNSKLVLCKKFGIRFKFKGRYYNFTNTLKRGALFEDGELHDKELNFICQNLWYNEQLKIWMTDPMRQMKKGKYFEELINWCINIIIEDDKKRIHHLMKTIDNMASDINELRTLVQEGQGCIKCPICRKQSDLNPCFIDGCKCCVCYENSTTILDCGHPLCEECGEKIEEGCW